MTEYHEQTSASDRYEAARKALADYDEHDEPHSLHERRMREYRLASALRALITPPATSEGEEQLATRFRDWITANGTSRTLGTSILPADATDDQRTEKRRNDLTLAFIHGVHAGIQSAHESWEPEVAQRPTQEQMLRWLGIEYNEGVYGEDSTPCLYIASQTIEREDD